MIRTVLLVTTALYPALSADVKLIEEIIAKVNGDIITRSEVERTRQQSLAELQQRGVTGAAFEQAVKQREPNFLRDRIDQLLLTQKGKELNINVDSEVSKQVADMQRMVKIPDPEKFQQFVKEQTGLPFEDYRSEMRNGFLTQRVLRQEVGSRVNIPRQEIIDYYEKNKREFVREESVFLREILVSTEGKDPAGAAAAEKKARDLVARARKGEKFHELARDHSEAATAENFGELGGAKRGDLKKEIEDLVFKLNKNEVTDPIKLPNGFLILKVEERHQAGQASLEEVENEIMEKLYNPRFQPKVREYLTQLRQEAFLEIKPGFVDSAAAAGKDTAWTDPAVLKPETVTKEEIAAQQRRKRLLWLVPIPFTKSVPKSSSK